MNRESIVKRLLSSGFKVKVTSSGDIYIKHNARVKVNDNHIGVCVNSEDFLVSGTLYCFGYNDKASPVKGSRFSDVETELILTLLTN